jgi:ascorbate PTS system EIIC component
MDPGRFVLTGLTDVLASPALLIGLVTLVGLALQRSPLTEIIKGAVKAAVGFLVMAGGATILVGSLDHFGTLFKTAFGLQGVVPNNEAITSIALRELGQLTALIMVCGMLVNILIARYTPLKFIFLTGHHTLFMAALFAAVLQAGGLPPALVVVLGAALLGVVMAFFPFLAQWVMRKITGGDDFALGHFGTTGYVAAALVGQWAGRNSKSTEDMVFPQSLLFFRETIVVISATMLLLFLLVMSVVAGREGIEQVHREITGHQNFLVFSTLQALTFAAGIYVVLLGVRLILGELVPAFKGISERLVPKAKPALDCPVVFPYAPNAVVIGFVSSLAGGLAALAVCGLAHWTLILPGVVPHFFCGATAGVFGNATGGRRGCVAGAFVHGLLITFLPLLLLPTLGSLGFQNTTFGDADFGVVGTLLGGLVALFRR